MVRRTIDEMRSKYMERRLVREKILLAIIFLKPKGEVIKKPLWVGVIKEERKKIISQRERSKKKRKHS